MFPLSVKTPKRQRKSRFCSLRLKTKLAMRDCVSFSVQIYDLNCKKPAVATKAAPALWKFSTSLSSFCSDNVDYHHYFLVLGQNSKAMSSTFYLCTSILIDISTLNRRNSFEFSRLCVLFDIRLSRCF